MKDIHRKCIEFSSNTTINNPYGFDPLNSEIHRIVKNGGTVRITGSLSNKNFNQYWKLDGVPEGFSAIYKGSQPGVQGFMTSGKPIHELTEKYIEVVK